MFPAAPTPEPPSLPLAVVYPAGVTAAAYLLTRAGVATLATISGHPHPDEYAAGLAAVGAAVVGTVFAWPWNEALASHHAVIPEPQPAQAQKPLRVEVVRDEGRRQDWLDLPITPAQAREIAACGYALTFNTYRLITPPELRALRYELVRRGLAVKEGRRVMLNAAGRAILRQAALPHRGG